MMWKKAREFVVYPNLEPYFIFENSDTRYLCANKEENEDRWTAGKFNSFRPTSDWESTGMLLSELRRRGIWVEIYQNLNEKMCFCKLASYHRIYSSTASAASLCHALSLATVKLIEQERRKVDEQRDRTRNKRNHYGVQTLPA
jgi:hypothetical protein